MILLFRMIIQMNVIKMLYFIQKTLSALYSAHSQHNITAIHSTASWWTTLLWLQYMNTQPERFSNHTQQTVRNSLLNSGTATH